MKDFKSFKQRCIYILSQSDNCIESQQVFNAAETYTDLVMAWQRFWAGVLREVPTQVITAFDELYDEYKDELNAAGMFYNEAPTITNGLTVLIGNSEEEIKIFGRAKVYVIGAAKVSAYDNVSVQCNNEDAEISVFDNARAIMEGGTCHAFNRALINGRGSLTCKGFSTVYISGGTLDDHGHNNIIAYNDAVITSFTDKNITLKDNSKLIIR